MLPRALILIGPCVVETTAHPPKSTLPLPALIVTPAAPEISGSVPLPKITSLLALRVNTPLVEDTFMKPAFGSKRLAPEPLAFKVTLPSPVASAPLSTVRSPDVVVIDTAPPGAEAEAPDSEPAGVDAVPMTKAALLLKMIEPPAAASVSTLFAPVSAMSPPALTPREV